MQAQNFELVVDGVPYVVKASPYNFNGEKRFTVSFNGSPEYIFVYDPTLGRLASIGDDSVDIPDNLESAISNRLQATVSA